MIGVFLVVIYTLLAVVVGIKVFFKTSSWLSKMEGLVPPVPLHSAIGWGIVAFLLALGFEGLILFSSGMTTGMLILTFLVGPIEEGAKLLPFVAKERESTLVRWHLTIRTALVFGILEALLYFWPLVSMGNLLGAIFRFVVVMFHVVFTAIALEGALRGSLWEGYLKAALLHSLYDAPALLLYIMGDLAGFVAPLSMVALIYIHNSVDEVFGSAVNYARRVAALRQEMYKTFEERYEMLNSGNAEASGAEEPEKADQKDKNEKENPEGFTSLP